MQTTVQTAGVTQSSKAGPLTAEAKTAWKVTFTTPAPKTMPAERLKARAELVRNALTSGTY